MTAKVKLRLSHRVQAVEQQHAELVRLFNQLHTENRKARAKDTLLTACLELLQWVEQRQEEAQVQQPSSAATAPASELLQLLGPSPAGGDGTDSPTSSSATASSGAAASGAAATAADAWRSNTIAPDARDPLALMRELLQRPMHPDAGPETTKQELVQHYNAMCSQLSLHLHVASNPRTPAESANSSAPRAKEALLDWFNLALSMLLFSPNPMLVAQLVATDCSTGETVVPDDDGLYEDALQRMQLSPQQLERIAHSYEVLCQLHAASLQEAMELRGTLAEPAAQLFASSVLPVGMVQAAAEGAAGTSAAGQQYEQHQASLQRLQLAMKKAAFWDTCLSACFVGAVTLNQAAELCLSAYPYPVRTNYVARKAAALYQQQQEQQAAAEKQQQEAPRKCQKQRRARPQQRRKTLVGSAGKADTTSTNKGGGVNRTVVGC